MKKLNFVIILLLMFSAQYSIGQDWANLNRFKNENANQVLPVPGEKRVVFMGNSITEGWINLHPEFFAGKFYINRGISGQTTPQMLLRFRADVIKLKPRVVVILAGTNDIAGNTGPSTLEMIEDNIISMAQLAKANDIKVILCSVLPVYDYPWKPGLNPAEKIVELNKMIKSYAAKSDIIYLDFFSVMVDERNGLKAEYSKDGVHPNEAGYKIMEPLTDAAIDKAFNINKAVTPAKKAVTHKKMVSHKKPAVKKAPVVQKKPVTQKAPVNQAKPVIKK